MGEQGLGQGKPIKSISCDKCGKRIPGNSKFCPFCGERISIEKKISLLPIIALTLLAVAVFVCLGLALDNNNYLQAQPQKGTTEFKNEKIKDHVYEEHTYNTHTDKFEFSYPTCGISKIAIPGDEGIVSRACQLNEYKWNEFGYDAQTEKESRCTGDCYLHMISADGIEKFSLFWSECPTTYSLGTVSDETLEEIAFDVAIKIFGLSEGDPVSYKLETLNHRTYLTIWASRVKINNYPDATYVRAYVTYYKGREYIFLAEQLEGIYITSEDVSLINSIVGSIEFE